MIKIKIKNKLNYPFSEFKLSRNRSALLIKFLFILSFFGLLSFGLAEEVVDAISFSEDEVIAISALHKEDFRDSFIVTLFKDYRYNAVRKLLKTHNLVYMRSQVERPKLQLDLKDMFRDALLSSNFSLIDILSESYSFAYSFYRESFEELCELSLKSSGYYDQLSRANNSLLMEALTDPASVGARLFSEVFRSREFLDTLHVTGGGSTHKVGKNFSLPRCFSKEPLHILFEVADLRDPNVQGYIQNNPGLVEFMLAGENTYVWSATVSEVARRNLNIFIKLFSHPNFSRFQDPSNVNFLNLSKFLALVFSSGHFSDDKDFIEVVAQNLPWRIFPETFNVIPYNLFVNSRQLFSGTTKHLLSGANTFSDEDRFNARTIKHELLLNYLSSLLKVKLDNVADDEFAEIKYLVTLQGLYNQIPIFMKSPLDNIGIDEDKVKGAYKDLVSTAQSHPVFLNLPRVRELGRNLQIREGLNVQRNIHFEELQKKGLKEYLEILKVRKQLVNEEYFDFVDSNMQLSHFAKNFIENGHVFDDSFVDERDRLLVKKIIDLGRILKVNGVLDNAVAFEKLTKVKLLLNND